VRLDKFSLRFGDDRNPDLIQSPVFLTGAVIFYGRPVL